MKKFAFQYLPLFVLSGLGVSLALNRFGYPLVGIDDANIFFVYARNLASGHGFVFNIGGERVEGFTSMLWTIIGAFAFKLSLYPELTLLFINTALMALSATIATFFLQAPTFNAGKRHQANSLLWPIIFLVLLFSDARYVTWTTITLMGNGLWSALLLLMTIVVTTKDLYSRNMNYRFIPLSILLLLARPESFLWVPLFIAILFVRRMLVNGSAKAFKEIMPPLIVAGLAVVLLTLFRIQYFGFPLPNTYYAKVAPSISYNLLEGTKYLVRYFTSNPIVSISILSVIFSSIHTTYMLFRKRCVDDGLMFLPLIAITGLFVPVLTGGDHFGSFRFYQSLYPILLLCLLYWIRFILPEYIHLQWNPALPSNARNAVAGILITCFVLIPVVNWRNFRASSGIAHEFEIADSGRKIGELSGNIFSVLSELPSLGVIISGGIKYNYPGEVIDLMGLNNTRMGHSKGNRRGVKNHAAFDKTIFYELNPAIIAPRTATEGEWGFDEDAVKKSFNNKVLNQILFERSFSERYVYFKISRKDIEKDEALVGWCSRDFLRHLVEVNAFHIETYEYVIERDLAP